MAQRLFVVGCNGFVGACAPRRQLTPRLGRMQTGSLARLGRCQHQVRRAATRLLTQRLGPSLSHAARPHARVGRVPAHAVAPRGRI